MQKQPGMFCIKKYSVKFAQELPAIEKHFHQDTHDSLFVC